MKSLYTDLPIVEVAGKKFVGRAVFVMLVIMAAAAGALSGFLLVYSTDLPQVGELEHYRPSAITEIYDDSGRVIGSFALQRRVIDSYDDFPAVLREAILSIEDKDFFNHWGVDLKRAAGAAIKDVVAGKKVQGASTLTMQLSRNLFLSPERNFSRKIQEIILAIQIERRFTKPQIFTMYANQIYLGHGMYGFEAGSEYYFGKPAKSLRLEEAAMLAALPKSPIQYSPILNPENALRRRNMVIDAMLEDGKITLAQAIRAKDTPIQLNIRRPGNSLAPYFVEEVRQYLENKYGSEQVHENGLRVYTTLNLDMQKAARQSVLDGLAAYEHRQGWRGHLLNVLRSGVELEDYRHPDWDDPIEEGSYVHALVTETLPGYAVVKFGRERAHLTAADVAWTGFRSAAQLLRPGDLVYLKVKHLPAAESDDDLAQVSLEEDSGTQGALLAIDNASGEIKAMVGGRDFAVSKFNRATQALRQVGSSFKAYVYTAALDSGALGLDDTILDAPVTFSSGSGPYTPSNYDNKFMGSISVATAVAQSRNIPALKVAQKTGIENVIGYARRFGITSPLPAVLPLALGAAEVTLWEQTAAFSTFPNDGVRVSPHIIRKVTDYEGHVLEESYPEVKDVVSAHTARVMTSLLQGVVQHGTAAQARQLNHPLAGKTGTTNDFTDAWFMGFSPSITCGVWVGFDEKKTLGNKETGAVAALPIWMDFMRVALQGRDDESFTSPDEPAQPLPQPVAKAVPVKQAAKGAGSGARP